MLPQAPKPQPTPTPAPKSAPATSQPDLFPEVTSFQFDSQVAKTLQDNGHNPDNLLKQANEAISRGGAEKAQWLEQMATLSDQIRGNNSTSNWLNSKRAVTQDQVAASKPSVGGFQAFLGLTANGIVDLGEGVGKLVAAYGNLGPTSNLRAGVINSKVWEDANKSIETFFEPLRTYVSDDYKQPLASYSKENGVDVDVSWKNLVGLGGNLTGYMLPGLLTAGVGSLTTIGTRTALKGAATAAARANLGSQLAQTASTISTATGLSAFFQTFPSYQKDALDAGIDMRNATLFAMPVAAFNALIETASVGKLAKAMGISDDLATQAIRAVTSSEVKTAMQNLAGKPLTKELFMETAKAASKGVLGQISSTKNMNAVVRMLQGTGRRIGRGFTEQGITEGGEEFMQALVENASKDLYNNFVAANSASEGAGKFEDPTWQKYAFDSLYGTLIGSVMGTATGTAFQGKYADPTVYGYVAADTRTSLSKDIPFEKLVRSESESGSLKAYSILDGALESGELSPEQHQDLIQKVGIMASVARDFQGIDGFADSDQVNMVTIAQTRQQLAGERQVVDGLKSEISALDSAISSGSLTPGEKLRSEIQRNNLLKQIGAPNADGVYAREQRVNEGQQAFDAIADQVQSQYATDAPRKDIANFFKNNLATWNRTYGTNPRYADPFVPTQMVTTASGPVAFDAGQKFFRRVATVGGEVAQPARLDDQGKFIPSTRNPTTYDTSAAVDDINEHLSISAQLSDPGSDLSQTVNPFAQPDTSLESGWIADGQTLIDTMAALESQPKKKKLLAEAKTLAEAYLRDSQFLATDAKYAESYAPVQAGIMQALGIEPEVQPIEQEITPEVEMLGGAETLGGSVENPDTVTQPQTTLTNATNPSQPILSVAPAPPAQQPDYAAELERAAALTIAEDAQQELDAALRAAEQGVEIDEPTLQRLVETLESANNALAAVAGEPDANVEQQSPDAGNASRRRTTTLREVWPTLAPQVQLDAANLATAYLNGYDGGNLSVIDQHIYATLGKIRDLKTGWSRWADPNSFTSSIARAYAATVNQNSALTLDQYVSVQQETMPGLTEQDVIDFITRFPTGPASARTYGLAPVRQQFIALTGKELNRAVAENVLSWQNGQPQTSPDGVETFGESALDAGQQLMFSLTPDDAFDLATLYRSYNERFGDAWLTELIADIDNTFPPLSEPLTARLKALTTTDYGIIEQSFTPIDATGTTGGNADSVSYSPEPVESTIEEPAENPAGETVGGTPAAVEQIVLAEIEAEILAESSQEPVTAEAVAPFDIALADATTRASRKQREIDGLRREVGSRVQTGNLFEAVDPLIEQAARLNIPAYKLKTVVTSIRQGNITPEQVQRITQGEVIRTIEELQAIVPGLNPDVFQALEDALAFGYLPTLVDSAQRLAQQPQVVAPQIDLFAGETTGIQAEEAARTAIAQREQELAAIQAEIKQLEQEKIRAAEQAVQASQEQTNLFEQQPLSRTEQIAARKAELRDAMRKKMMGQLSSNPMFDPQFIGQGVEYLTLSIEEGIIRFTDFARDFANGSSLAQSELNVLRGLYKFFRSSTDEVTRNTMDSDADVDLVTLADVNPTTNDTGTTTSLESDRPRAGTTDSVGQSDVQPAERTGTQPGTRTTGRRTPSTGSQPAGNLSLFGDAAPVVGESGNQQLFNRDRGTGMADGSAGGNERGGSGIDRYVGIQPERSATDAVAATPAASRAATTDGKLAAQAAAENIPVIVGDKVNIDETLPFLMASQREDVYFAEQRFAKPNGYGVLFTNGTGTGKTLLAMGIIKRMVKQGKTNGLVVVPNAAVMNEWLTSAPWLGLTINPLENTKDGGQGVAITTYANFGQNDAISLRPHDFVVIDEAHNVMQGQQSDETAALGALRAITLHPKGTYALTDMQNRDLVNRIQYLRTQIAANSRIMNNDDTMDSVALQLAVKNSEMQDELDVLQPQYDQKLQANRELIAQSQNERRPRAVFLSATPFGYRENIQWAEGYLFDFAKVEQGGGYNSGGGYERFMMQHFGYRMRYNKLTKPDAEVNTDLMERQFNAWLQKEGVAASRVLDIDSDYQRLFALTPSAVGTKIDEGLQWLREAEDGRYFALYEMANKRFDYLQRQRLLEAIKAEESIPLIEKWHELGKKVVVFYDFNEGGGFSPFQFESQPYATLMVKNGDGKQIAIKQDDLVKEFYSKRADLAEINTGQLPAPLITLTKNFPTAGIVNGNVSKTKKVQNIRDFNDDTKPEANLLIVQAQSNAGWSGHDKSGQHKRVLLNLGMPTAPTRSIQQEGRIYRTGQSPNSDSMFVYMNTGTTWERIAFASTIASRAGTAENLGMGELARGLKDAFINAFEESETYTPSAEEGRGGKAKDRSLVKPISLFEKAKTFFFGIQKKTAKTKAAEGVDYFATPEPLGLKMVEWAGIRPGERALEPSAGHGAISRWFPEDANNTLIEPSSELFSRASLTSNGKKLNERFEDHNIINKYDVIAMDPPFGTAGKMASDHVEKAAVKHLQDGGRLVALVPMGSFNDKFDKWFYATNPKTGEAAFDVAGLHLSARILLPSGVFGRAGTNVSTQILVIDRVNDPKQRQNLRPTQNLDLSSAEDLTEFFDRIEDLSIRDRPNLTGAAVINRTTLQQLPAAETVATAPVTSSSAPAAPAPVKEPVKVFHQKNQKDIFVVQTSGLLERDEYNRINSLAKSRGGYYSSFKGNGAIPGFVFNDQITANSFYSDVTGGPVVVTPAVQPETRYQLPDPGVQQEVQPADNPALTALVDQLSQAFPNTAVFTDAGSYERALMESDPQNKLAGRRPKGFVWKGSVYLDPTQADANTAFHEFGHLWADITRQNNPELYKRGVELVRDTRYFTKLRLDPYYKTMSNAALEEEALAQAIGDKGAQFGTPTRKSSFLGWLAELWDGIKQALGFPPTTDMENMTLDDFAQLVVGELMGGQALDSGTQANPESSGPMFQLPTGVTATTIEDMRVAAEDQLANPPQINMGVPTNLTMDLLNTPKNLWTKADRAYIKGIATATGWELTDVGELTFRKPKGLFHLANGQAANIEGYAMNAVLQDGFVSAFTDATNRGRLFRTMFDNMKVWTNLETFLVWLDNQAGTIRTLFTDLKRETARRAAYAQVLLQPLKFRAEQALANFSESLSGEGLARTLTVNTYDYDAGGNIVVREVELPVAVAMELVATGQSQLSSHGQIAHVTAGPPSPNILYRANPDGSLTRNPRGAMWLNPQTEQTEFLLLDQSEFDALADRFLTGNGGFTGEVEAFSALHDYYNHPEIVKLLEEENGYLNPDQEFVRVADYHPLRSFKIGDAKQQSRGYSRTLDESRQLIERQGLADAYVIRDPLVTMQDYQSSVTDILEHGRLVDNLNSLVDGINTDYTGPKQKEIVNYLQARVKEYQSHRMIRAEAYENRRYLRWMENLMQRFTQSVFSVNIGLPLKQTGTYAAALGQGIIADEYLQSTEALGTLARLTGAAYRDVEANATVIDGTEQGFVGDLTGTDTAERELLDELLGNNLGDPLAKQRQMKRNATVLNRLTSSQTMWTGDVEFRDLGLDNATVTKGRQLLRKMDEWTNEHGLAAMKRADRAVILAYYTAAKLQAQAEGLDPMTDAYWDRVAGMTEGVVYATNQMSNLTEMTPLQTSVEFISKILGLYSGQQQKLLNTVMQSLTQWIKTGEGTPEAAAALAKLGQTFAWSIMANALWVSVISAGSSVLMALLSGDEPKDADVLLEGIGWDFLRNVAGTAPGFGSQAAEYYISQFDNRRGSDDLLQIPAVENLQNGLKILVDAGKALTEEDEQKRSKNIDSAIYGVTDFMGKATGLPTSVIRVAREHLTTDEDD